MRKRVKQAELPVLQPASGLRWRHLALLAVLSFLVYANSFAGEFIGDDTIQIARNENIRSLDNIPQDFTTSLWAFASPNKQSNDRYYRPLQNVIYTLTYQVGGLSPLAYHVVNVALHAAAGIMVYLLCLELGLLGSASLFAAALFAVHPVHTEAVAWIAGVGDVACGLFYFAALWTLVRFLNHRGSWWLGLSAVCFLLALFSKEMAVTFPVAAILVLAMKWDERHLVYKRAALLIAPYILVLAIYGVIRLSVLGLTLPSTFEDHPSAFDWFTLGVWMFGRYLRYAFLPYPLASFHPVPLYFSYRIFSTCIYALGITVLVLLLWVWRTTVRTGIFWLIMFAGMLAPVFYFKGIAGGNLFAERYLYIPTLPAMALLAALWTRLGRKAAVPLAASLIVVFAGATVARNRDWRNDETLYTRTLEIYPENVYTCLTLGALYLDASRYEEAQKCLEIAEKHIDDPQFGHPRPEKYRLEVEFGTLAARQGKAGEAQVHLQRAIEINPAASDAYTLLAGVLMNLERNFEAAIPLLEKGIALGPSDDQARDSMGVALYNLKQYDEAVRYFREALRINPDSILAQQHLNTALKRVQN